MMVTRDIFFPHLLTVIGTLAVIDGIVEADVAIAILGVLVLLFAPAWQILVFNDV